VQRYELILQFRNGQNPTCASGASSPGAQHCPLQRESYPVALLHHSQGTTKKDSFSFGNARPCQDPYMISSVFRLYHLLLSRKCQGSLSYVVQTACKHFLVDYFCFQAYLQTLAALQLKQFLFCSSSERVTRVTRLVFAMDS